MAVKIEKEFIELMLEAPSTQMDDYVKEDIVGLGENPSALDILFMLDRLVYWAGASDFVISIFQELLARAMTEENTILEELAKKRDWSSPEFERGEK